jgi:hypothetical protein
MMLVDLIFADLCDADGDATRGIPDKLRHDVGVEQEAHGSEIHRLGRRVLDRREIVVDGAKGGEHRQ